jgi:hypothetical protein
MYRNLLLLESYYTIVSGVDGAPNFLIEQMLISS